MYQSVRDAFYDFNAPLEGVLDWMYLDIKGLVTIGVGNLIDPVNLALGLPFEHEAGSGNFATSNEIQQAWEMVKSKQSFSSKGAKAFKDLNDLRLSDAAIRSLVDNKLSSNEAVLKSVFSDFESFPADAQLALLSMAWAMGVGFTQTFPKFRAACSQQNWDIAATECSINAVGNPGVIRRNEADQTLFFNAARVLESQSYQLDTLYYPTILLPEVVVTPDFR